MLIEIWRKIKIKYIMILLKIMEIQNMIFHLLVKKKKKLIMNYKNKKNYVNIEKVLIIPMKSMI